MGARIRQTARDFKNSPFRVGKLCALSPLTREPAAGIIFKISRAAARGSDLIRLISTSITIQKGMVQTMAYNVIAEKIAYEGLTLLMGALLAYPDTFEFYDKSRQNATFLTWLEGEHHTQWRLQYTINAIHQLFAE